MSRTRQATSVTKNKMPTSRELGSPLPWTFGISCHCRGRSAYPASNSSNRPCHGSSWVRSPKKTQKFQSNVIRIVPLYPIHLSDLHHFSTSTLATAEPRLGRAANAISKERQNVVSMRLSHLHRTIHHMRVNFPALRPDPVHSVCKTERRTQAG